MIALLLLLATPDRGVAHLLEKEADVSVDKPGLARLPLPAEVLSQSRPDLGDVRLYAPNEVEIPYIVDSGGQRAEVKITGPLKATGLSREKRERDDGPPIYRETYELSHEGGGPFTLVIETALPRFVRRVTINDGESMPLFRVRNAARTELSIPAEKQTLHLVIEGEDDGFLEPRFFMRREKQTGSAPRDLDVPYDKVQFSERDKKTVLTVERTPGLVPNMLILGATTELFDRHVTVFDGDRQIGSGNIFRVGGFAPYESMSIPVRAPRGRTLRVEIDDLDSPPLAGVTLRGVVQQPSLVFFAPVPTVQLRFGGGRATRPRYDVADLGDVAFERLLPARVTLARGNPSFDSKPALAFAMRPGAVVDVRKFTHRRGVTIDDSREGLTLLALGPEDQAHLRPDLGDVRIVDKKGRQWPYLLAPRAQNEWLPLSVAAPVTENKTSRHALRHDFGAVHASAIELDVGNSFVDRAFDLYDAKAESLLLSGRLQRSAESKAPLRVALASDQRTTGYVLVVKDGDDAPLAIEGARASFDIDHVYVAAEPGAYFVFFGAPNETRPTYEIERARETVLAVRANLAELDAVQDNPDYTVASKLDEKGTALEIGLWVAIGLAVLVLGGLTLRLSREPPT